MAYDLDEQEQLDEIKAFWKQWGNIITWAITAVALAVAAYYGYLYYQRTQANAAAPIYEQLEKAASSAAMDPKNAQLVEDLANTLTKQYGRTAYAQMGAVMAAKVQLDNKKLPQAQALLTWAMDNAKDAEYQHIARVRLAGLFLEDKKLEQALALLPEDSPKGFEALFADRKGDVLSAMGKKELAIGQYQKAWSTSVEGASFKEVLEQKLIQLGADTPTTKTAVK